MRPSPREEEGKASSFSQFPLTSPHLFRPTSLSGPLSQPPPSELSYWVFVERGFRMIHSNSEQHPVSCGWEGVPITSDGLKDQRTR